MTAAEVEALIDNTFAEQWGRLVSILISQTGDFELAEECVQEAFAAAWQSWPDDGAPDRPVGWLTTVARRRAVDRIRRDRLGRDKVQLIMGTVPDLYGDVDLDVDLDALDSGIADERLRLLFTCCHPALSLESQVALALRTLLGLSVAEIARAFGVSEAAMTKRLSRTKIKIRDAGIPYRVPPAAQLPQRTNAVLGTIYLLANEGYATTAGDRLTRQDLSQEGLRLAALAAELMPDDAEVLGLYALLLLHRARADSRTDAEGVLIPLEEQDRGSWDRTMITSALELIKRAARQQRIGPYQLQAMIAGCHASAATAEVTDWPMINSLYDLLLHQVPSPTVRLNRIIAIAMQQGPDAGLALLEEGAGQLPDSHLVPATRADLLRRLGRDREAAIAYQEAIDGCGNTGERRYLQRRLASVKAA